MPLVIRQLAVWTVVCGICAAPSFVLAPHEYNRPTHVLAMLAGIACFVAAYTAVSCTEVAHRVRRRPFVLTTLKIGYGSRMTLSFLNGFGAMLFVPTVGPDLWIGVYCIEFATECGWAA